MQLNRKINFERVMEYVGKGIKDLDDIINEKNELYHLYYNKEFEKMIKHIQKITYKHPLETIIWNIAHPKTPNTYEECFITASDFLYANAVKILFENGIKINDTIIDK